MLEVLVLKVGNIGLKRFYALEVLVLKGFMCWKYWF